MFQNFCMDTRHKYVLWNNKFCVFFTNFYSFTVVLHVFLILTSKCLFLIIQGRGKQLLVSQANSNASDEATKLLQNLGKNHANKQTSKPKLGIWGMHHTLKNSCDKFESEKLNMIYSEIITMKFKYTKIYIHIYVASYVKIFQNATSFPLWLKQIHLTLQCEKYYLWGAYLCVIT